jgi:hypothetical protein
MNNLRSRETTPLLSYVNGPLTFHRLSRLDGLLLYTVPAYVTDGANESDNLYYITDGRR